MHWQLKSAAFRVLANVPFGDQLHFFAQRHVVGSFPRPVARLDALWARAQYFVERFSHHAPTTAIAHSTFVEIGAGRDLSVPIALRLAGVGRVWPVDVGRLVKLDLVRHAARHMAANVQQPAPVISSWEDLEASGIYYRAPATLGSLELPAGSVDCICSNEVLEHIAPAALHQLAADTRRLLKPTGIAVHTIDYSDHYARSDTHIDRFNFLMFDDAQWNKHNSGLQYVNRLRHRDYLDIFTSHGLVVLEESVTPGTPVTTTTDRLASRFRGYSTADLFGLNGRLVLGRAR
jgi:SAM-dependent methyltransferase